MIRVEYFIIFNKKDEYLKKEEDFKHILQVIEGVNNVEETLLKYDDIDINYKVKYIDSDDRIINCEFSIEEDIAIEKFEKFLRVFRSVFIKLVGVDSFEILCDDIGFYYAKLAYPEIHIIENKMRSLLTQFMYINVGRNWQKDYTPKEVVESIKDKENKKLCIANFLDKVDFIQLKNFLFEEYSSKDKNKIVEFIKKNKDKKLEYSQLEEYIPISNWDRFFKSKLNIDSKELEGKWETLYHLRCKVAHNNKINKSEYLQIKELSEYIGSKIDDAIENLANIQIEEDDKANIIEKINKDNQEELVVVNRRDLDVMGSNKPKLGLSIEDIIDDSKIRQVATSIGKLGLSIEDIPDDSKIRQAATSIGKLGLSIEDIPDNSKIRQEITSIGKLGLSIEDIPDDSKIRQVATSIGKLGLNIEDRLDKK